MDNYCHVKNVYYIIFSLIRYKSRSHGGVGAAGDEAK